MVARRRKRHRYGFNIAVLDATLSALQDDVQAIKSSIRMEYVRRFEFGVVKSVVFGCVGIVLVVFLGLLLTLVLEI